MTAGTAMIAQNLLTRAILARKFRRPLKNSGPNGMARRAITKVGDKP
jgi:hypothetical protein